MMADDFGVPDRSWNKPLHRSRRSASTHDPNSPNGGPGERCRYPSSADSK